MQAASKAEIRKYLSSWAIPYIKNKDILQKQLCEVKETEYGIYARYQAKNGFFFLEPEGALSSLVSSRNEISEPNAEIIVVFFNTKDNLKKVVSEWKKLSLIKNLKVLFINPESQTDTKWIIAPYVHSLVCDEHSIARGLKSMFEMVEPLTENKISRIVALENKKSSEE